MFPSNKEEKSGHRMISVDMFCKTTIHFVFVSLLSLAKILFIFKLCDKSLSFKRPKKLELVFERLSSGKCGKIFTIWRRKSYSVNFFLNKVIY